MYVKLSQTSEILYHNILYFLSRMLLPGIGVNRSNTTGLSRFQFLSTTFELFCSGFRRQPSLSNGNFRYHSKGPRPLYQARLAVWLSAVQRQGPLSCTPDNPKKMVGNEP